MKAETIIAIVTAAVAFVTSVASFTYNLIQNRKSRIQKIVLDNRVKYLYGIRDGFSAFVGLANIGAIKVLKGNSEASKAYFSNLFSGYGNIKTYIKPFYDIDKELLQALDKLYYQILAIINGESSDVALLDGLREDFVDKYLKYDWAYWKYIQRQKSGEYFNSDDAFDEVYEQFIDSLKK